MIERMIEIGGQPLKIYDINRKGITAITNKSTLSAVFDDVNPKTNVSYLDYGESYAIMKFGYTYGSMEDLDVGAQIQRKFNQWYYGVTQNNILYWYRGLFPLLNSDKMLVSRLELALRITAPPVFRIKKGDDGKEARDFADVVFQNREKNAIKKLIWASFKGQRTFANFDVDLDSDDKMDKGTINIAFLFVSGEVPKFAGLRVFGSRAVKKALKSDPMAFYRGFIAPHLSIFEGRMRNVLLSSNFTINYPQTLGNQPQFQSIMDAFGRTASDNNLRNKVIRLAHKKPELRKHLLPLLKIASEPEIVIFQKGKGAIIKKSIGGTGSLKEGLALAKKELQKLGVTEMRPLMSSFGSKGLAAQTFTDGYPANYSLSISYFGRGVSDRVLDRWSASLGK